MKGKVIITFIAFFFGMALNSDAQNRKYKKHYKPKHHKVYHRAPAHPGAVVILPPRPPRPAVVRAPRPRVVLPPAPPRPPLPPRPHR
ncbi:MAG: hypothetical protein ABIN74_10230 [Ferruginibacter sp.]